MSRFKNLQITNMVKFNNATEEQWKVYSNNKAYRFDKRGSCEVPALEAELIYQQHKNKGIYPVFDDTDVEAAEREALVTYVEKLLEDRIQMGAKHNAEVKNASGVEREETRLMKQARRWKDEIFKVLEYKAPVYEESSYLDRIKETNKAAAKKTKTKQAAQTAAV